MRRIVTLGAVLAAILLASWGLVFAPAESADGGPYPFSCSYALNYLRLYAEPHFRIQVCDGRSTGGAQAMTCQSSPPLCAVNERVIVIAVPCPVAYRNEAANSWIVARLRPGPYDPFGPEC